MNLKDWNRGDLLTGLTILIAVVLGIPSTILQYLALPATARSELWTGISKVASIIAAPVPVPLWLLVVGVVLVVWAVWKAWPRRAPPPPMEVMEVKTTAAPKPTALTVEKIKAMGGFKAPGEKDPEPEVSERGKRVVLAFRHRGNKWALTETIAKWVELDPVMTQYELDKLHALRLVDWTEFNYKLSSKGIAYAIEKLDG